MKTLYKILVINFGGTSTKIAVYDDEQFVEDHVFRHSLEDMRQHSTSREQVAFRKGLILDWLTQNGYPMQKFSCVAMMGGTIKEAKRSGVYLLSGKYKEGLLATYVPDEPPIHGNRIITPITLELIGDLNIPVYVADPPSVDEFDAVSRIVGVGGGYERRSAFHALSQKATGRKMAKDLGREYKDCRFVVAHMGAGISVGAHRDAKVVDVNDVGEGEGPFTPQRAGTVPTYIMLDLCFDKGLTKKEAHKRIRGAAGLIGLLGTDNIVEVEKRIAAGDEYAAVVLEAMAYQIAKEIGACVAALEGRVDAIGLTGGIAYSAFIMNHIKKRVSAFAPILEYPGECENEALALGAYRVVSGQEQALTLD